MVFTSPVFTPPEAEMHILAHSDGSSTYTVPGGYSIACVVNGPLEVMRRDEQAQEMHVEVHIRPAAGMGGPFLRHLESIIRPLLTNTILLRAHPRTLLQITLQILASPSSSSTYPPSLNSSHPQGYTSLFLLPHLIHSAELALLDACIPLSTAITAAAVAIDENDSPIRDAKTTAKSVHVFAFSPVKRECLFSESSGEFTPQGYKQAYESAMAVCCGEINQETGDSQENLHQWLRGTVQAFVEEQSRWKLAVAEEK